MQEHKLEVKILTTHTFLHQLHLKYQSKVLDLMVDSERDRNSILMGLDFPNWALRHTNIARASHRCH